MARKIHSVLAITLLFASVNGLFAQDKMAKTATSDAPKYSLFAPNNQAEFGISVGYSTLIGDFAGQPGVGLGLSIRKALDYTFSIRGELGYQMVNSEAPTNGAFPYLGDVTKNTSGTNANDPRIISSTKTNLLVANVDVLISLNNSRWESGARTINPYVFGGAGISSVSTKVNVSKINPTTITGLTTGEQDLVIPGDRNNGSLAPMIDAGVGIAFKINDKMSFSIEEKMTTLFGKRADLLDGYEFGFRDFVSNTNIRLGFNIGVKDKKTTPLWWASPAEQMNADIAELKARPKYDPTDTDGDGVIDMLDQEKETPAGARVDTRGVALDSDSDGIPDYKDKEPFSPVGYKVDANGVAMVPKPNYVTEADVDRIVEAKLAKFRASLGDLPTAKTVGMADWFLPMIHFDLNSSVVKNSEYGSLEAVASVLKSNPNIRVAVEGHTDKTATDGYNQGLSYRRAQASIDALVKNFKVDRSRLVLTYEGENQTLVPTNGVSYMNRRVEFKVATSQTEMSAPTKEMKKKSYKGNKSGY